MSRRMYQIEVTVDETWTESAPTAQPGPPDVRGELSSLLIAASRATLAHEHAPSGELAILLTGDEQMAAMNEAYRGISGPTDVLSFASEIPPLPDLPHYFGDIAISVPRAQEQSAQAGHPLVAELQLLVVHGTLHLLGHDHAEEVDTARMWAAQDAILQSLGAPLRSPQPG